jgi:glycosyltransferase involved in cell wall biosynthesis
MQPLFSIHAMAPGYYDESRVGYSLVSILRNVASPTIGTWTYVLGKPASLTDKKVLALLPNTFYRYTSRWIRRPSAALAARFGHRMRRGDIAYMWVENPPEVTRALQHKGVLVVREMINCTLSRRREELRRAYQLLGLPDQSGISDADIALEQASLLAADAVFCPNRCVYESVKAYGVAAQRCIRASYGWSPERINGSTEALAKSAGTTFLFVGTADVRKGFPCLLEAWDAAHVEGRLVIAGVIEPWLQERYAHILSRPDVVSLGYVRDIGAVYRSADVFCFPSWEEGGPMVTIEAMGAGLPCIVTEMGGSGIVDGPADGAIVVAPGDVGAMTDAIRRLSADPAARQEMGHAARRTAEQYTWQKVGQRRSEALVRLRESAGFGAGRT